MNNCTQFFSHIKFKFAFTNTMNRRVQCAKILVHLEHLCKANVSQSCSCVYHSRGCFDQTRPVLTRWKEFWIDFGWKFAFARCMAALSRDITHKHTQRGHARTHTHALSWKPEQNVSSLLSIQVTTRVFEASCRICG